MTLVVDASVAAKWYVSEEYSAAARRLFFRSDLRAPAHLSAELANVFVNKARRGQLTEEVARALSTALPNIPVTFVPLRAFVRDAVLVALAHGRSVYDALYVALALADRSQLATADRRLYNALARVYPNTMLWVEDIPDT